MDNEKIQELIAKLKEFGLDDEKILDVFFEVFKAGKMSKEDLGALAESMGYELDEEFEKEDVPAEEGKEDASNVSEEEAEDLKEIKPGESEEEFKEKVEEAKESPVGDDDDKVDEDKEWDEARKLFKL